MAKKISFTPSKNLTLGVEIELQLIDPVSGDLTSKSSELLSRLKPIECSGEVKPELTYSMVEMNTTIHSTIESLSQELYALKAVLLAEAEKLGIRLSGGGIHPFQKWSERHIYPSYQLIYDQYDFLAKKFTVFGQHIHIGCEQPDDAVYLMHCFANYIPHFIALSASSPFYEGVKTHFDSTRLPVVDAFPLSGHIPPLKNWNAFKKYFKKMQAFNIVKTFRNFYWDIRLRPDFGTFELRVCDTPLTMRRVIALAAYAQAIAAYCLAERPAFLLADLYLPYAYNRFQAMKQGLKGVLSSVAGPIPIRTDILETLERITPYAQHLGSEDSISYLKQTVTEFENDAEILRKKYNELNQVELLPLAMSELWKR